LLAAVEGETAIRKTLLPGAKSVILHSLCDTAVLLGGITLRCLIVFASYPVWNNLLQ
jgi:hypothetical protein